jgi:Tol biopolymer transport system component
MADLSRGTLNPFTTSDHEDQNPVWSPDGRLVYFDRHAGKSSDLYVKDSDGSNPERLVFSSPEEKVAGDVTRDGRRLVVTRRDLVNGYDLWTVSTAGDPDPLPLLRTPANEGWPRLSPDNQWFAYGSDETGSVEVYVRPFPSGTGKWQVSSGGGLNPFWARDGRRLFFSSGRKLMEADIDTASGFSAGTPREVPAPERLVDLDAMPDGKTFAAILKGEEGPRSIDAIVNCTALLEK